MDTTAFYAASSGLCFTLLGFWWVVVQFRHAELTADRETRRFIFLVSLHFIVPGVVSLASLLATGPMWRVAFGLAGITGVIAAIAGTRAGAAHPVLADVRRWAWLGIPIYALVTVIALVPDIVRSYWASSRSRSRACSSWQSWSLASCWPGRSSPARGTRRHEAVR